MNDIRKQRALDEAVSQFAIPLLLMHVRDCWIAIHNDSPEGSGNRALAKERAGEAEALIRELGLDPSSAPFDMVATVNS